MENVGVWNIKQPLHASFAQIFIFTGESFTNLTFYADLVDSTRTKKTAISVTKTTILYEGVTENALLLELTRAQIDTAAIGNYFYDVKSINSTSDYIRRRIKGTFNIHDSETVIA